MKRRKIAISIDVDYFCRELPEWDFGHNEDNPLMMSDIVWASRYASYPLHKLTSLKYADCKPEQLFVNLQGGGLWFSKDTKIGAGVSHKDAYAFFLKEDFHYLINIDAHHDCYKYNSKLDCGNWLLKLKEQKKFLSVWVLPKWIRNIPRGENPDKNLINRITRLHALSELIGYGGDVTAVYIAQSPAWMPPHFDKHYLELVRQLQTYTTKSKLDYDGGYCRRKGMTKKEAEKIYGEMQLNLKKLNSKLKEKANENI